MSIGDINSSERGSGARYLDGKTRFEYVPARVLLEASRYWLQATLNPPDLDNAIGAAESVLYELANFEETGDGAALIEALGWIDWRETCDVFHYGATKYAPWNWLKGMPWSVPLACAKRHLVAILFHGEVNDPESGLSHLGHAGSNVVMLMHYARHYLEGNDLPPSKFFGRASCEDCKAQVSSGGVELVKAIDIEESNYGAGPRPFAVDAVSGESVYKPLTSADYARMRGEVQ